MAAYARLKRDLAGGTDDLVAILENARRTLPLDTDEAKAKAALFQEIGQSIAELTRREVAVVWSTLQQLGFTVTATSTETELTVVAPDLTREQGLQRLWTALQTVETLGVPVEAIASWTRIVDITRTQQERFDLARDVKNMVKARYEPENWQRIAQPIFDKLRQRQRDALVAYIMDQQGFDRIEQLFEYFLIDPGMEPVVQTSRLRLAISSVQLFIQRCLLNLELFVQPHPDIINSQHWQWMKRYHVWEANRKILLWPENWLEPEFRDDKTYLFQEFEGALLQGDVSRDLVEDAFYHYLKELETLARLEIVSMYAEEKPQLEKTLHIIGRTPNGPHKYFIAAMPTRCGRRGSQWGRKLKATMLWL